MSDDFWLMQIDKRVKRGDIGEVTLLYDVPSDAVIIFEIGSRGIQEIHA
jgi:hypothetical protein